MNRPFDEPPRSAPAVRGWAWLLGTQGLIALALFHEFLFGTKVFSYGDIGSDSHAVFVPQLMHLANYVRSEGWPMWSFAFGLGAPFLNPADPFAWLSVAGGADEVLGLRIWVYVAKLVLGGCFFHAFLLRLAIRPEAALIGAVLYTFSGYAIINGQWDPMASEVALYPVLLWAMAHRLQGGNRLVLPFAFALVLIGAGLFLSVIVFTLWCALLAVLFADAPAAEARRWLGMTPLFGLGLCLAAPAVFPNALLLLDSPRVSAAPADFMARLGEAFALNTPDVLFSQLAGFFHKDLLGAGNAYAGWTNYLEGPGFYVGTLALLLIPQLWREPGQARRLLVVGLGVIVIYLLFPFLRGLAFGFAVPYFRVSSLWLSMGLLLLAVFALDRVLRQGVDRTLLAVAVLISFGLPLLLRLWRADAINDEAILRLFVATLAGALLLGLAATGIWKSATSRGLAIGILLLTSGEIILVAYPSYHRDPGVLRAGMLPHADLSQRLAHDLQQRDPGFYRIEKTFDTISEADALAQGYFGTKSYGYSGSSAVRFYTGLGLINSRPGTVNASNWLPGFGQRYPLHSLAGVRYMLSRQALPWAGFRRIGQADDVHVYQNDLALPLGVIHYRQIAESTFFALRGLSRDTAMFHGVVSAEPLASLPTVSGEELAAKAAAGLDTLYVEPALQLRRDGMVIKSFSQNRLSGEVAAAAPGVLVLSMPFYAGWQVSIDGAPATPFRANLGMTAVAIKAGRHQVEWVYRPPGQAMGLVLAGLALVVLLLGQMPGWRFPHRKIVA